MTDKRQRPVRHPIRVLIMPDKKTFRLDLQYDGRYFAGWQKQPDVLTVEGALRDAYGRYLSTEVFIDGSGRTDTGVHARHQIAILKAETRVPAHAIRLGVIPYLHEGLTVFSAEEVSEDWQPRPAFMREYRYFLWKGTIVPFFYRPFATPCQYELDIDSMRAGVAFIPGEKDFSTFRAAGCTANHPIRRVEEVEIVDRGDALEFRIVGNAFLRQMVRIMVGTLVQVGRGLMPPEQVGEILEKRDRKLAGPTLQPQGLFLWRIQLSPEEELAIPPTIWETGL
ncbi:MAG: tRNA pseudouridine(38-40) synthase TruA [Candidatus Omnitrophica bacterium]|nr:tRNA pseudouridine(38-40) synthase TruA [Candidatus Omnitrophota bacterium]